MKNKKFLTNRFITVDFHDYSARYKYNLRQFCVSGWWIFEYQDKVWLGDTYNRSDALAWANHYDIPCPDEPEK